MGISKKTIGTGITAREVDEADGEDILQILKQFSDRWNANRERGGGDYGAITASMEDELNHILAKAGPEPFERDSKEDFARRILDRHYLAKKLIEARDADGAARFACQAGYLYCEGAMKFTWEPIVEVGRRLESNRDKRNDETKAKSRADIKPFYELFEKLKNDQPHSSRKRIYVEMISILGLDPKTKYETLRSRVNRYKRRMAAERN